MAAQAGLCLAWSETPKNTFCRVVAHMICTINVKWNMKSDAERCYKCNNFVYAKNSKVLHACHKLWTEICEIRQNFKWDLIKFCEIFTKITLKLLQSSQKPLFECMKLIINTTKFDVCLFLHKMCCKLVWKFCEIWKSYGNWLPDEPNSVKFYMSQCEIPHVCCCCKNIGWFLLS